MTNKSVSENRQFLIPKNFIIVLTLAIVLLCICVLASLAFGSRIVGWNELMDGLFHPDVQSHGANVVRQRMARTIFIINVWCCIRRFWGFNAIGHS